jgi:hypothetical protein
MAQIDLPLAAELLMALLLVATLDCPQPDSPPTEQSLSEPLKDDPPQVGWTPENDPHAQRILRLENRAANPASQS